MDKKRLQIIESVIQQPFFVEKLNSIDHNDCSVFGNLTINLKELSTPLDFDFKIYNEYPLKCYDSESILFINKKLIPYNHVMESGNICIHTSHNTNIEEKLQIDLNSLKQWILKYYVNETKDLKFEHIIVNESIIKDSYYSYLFTETAYQFPKGDYGITKLSSLNQSIYKEKSILNYFIQDFISSTGKQISCNWSNFYKGLMVSSIGIYYFLEDIPAVHDKFAFKYWNQLNFSYTFLDFLYNFEKKKEKKFFEDIIPLFVGYRINNTETHWQGALLEIGKFPIEGVPIRKDNKKTGRWRSKLKSEEIKWSLTRNVSYKYFFGRGLFSKELTEKRILIIGIGAIGSMVAKTLTNCGCRFIDFIDYDIKEPENVCRSEFKFSNGISSKSEELINVLSEISPFVNTTRLNNDYFERLIKSSYSDICFQDKFKENLTNYDVIFDCSTDNDLMYVLSELEMSSELINISITNHAMELVCAFHPNIYTFVNNQFTNILKNDTHNLYEPTGCWNPTFKASYNDLNLLVQYTLKHINNIFRGNKPKNNFVIKQNESSLRIVEY